MEKRSELGGIGGGDKSRETVDSEKQTEDFGGEGGWGLSKPGGRY